ncbi:tetratricopeptide repeat protein [Flavobacterium sp. MDT1-60]|uniref:tetratricopeptide repeat protein n=1 Tax=Flavobacterium sp. MDT1-60 TaxID=1979344 RepID=UPI0017837CFC|nr:tetratricopeptide repeat protein [Flavobacterium sp. MDT1-60]QOG02884.1 tetratricopeptide repeat protein [Flavobacterium sp. MDT1-60]
MKSIFYFLFFLILTTTFGQQKNAVIEDDYEILKEKIRLYYNADNDRALMYAEQMAKSSNYEHLAFANGVMSCLLQRKGEVEKSKEKYNKAFVYLAKIPDSKAKKSLTADIYNYGGLTEWIRGNFSAALEEFQKGIEISSQLGDIKQIIKFKANIALVNESVGNYQLSIKNSRELLEFINKNEGLFTDAELLNRKSNLYLALGSAYESYFVDKGKMEILDSLAYFYKKTIQYSEKFPYNTITAKLSLGNVFNWKGDYKNAEKTYLEVVSLAKQNGNSDLSAVYYNLGDINLTVKKYNKALSFYKKSDSISLLNDVNTLSYLKSNCYQARIYNILNMPELAHKHSRIYLDQLDEYESKLREERLKVNYKQGEENLTAEMLAIDKTYREDLFFKRLLSASYFIIFFGIIFLLIKNIRDKNRIRKKLIGLIAEPNAKA